MGRPQPIYESSWVRSLFDRIASRYDILNDFFSLGIHRFWKRKAVRLIGNAQGKRILDAATGTGDLAFQLERAGAIVTGIDFSAGMLAVAEKRKGSQHSKVTFLHGDILQLPFSDDLFDAATVAFGVRNFEDPARGVAELWRVLKPGGKLVILEFGNWSRIAVLRRFLSKFTEIAKADSEAYSHLLNSSLHFPSGKAFSDRFLKALCGSEKIRYQKLFFGVAHLYVVHRIAPNTEGPAST